jgi:hypothetical protein
MPKLPRPAVLACLACLLVPLASRPGGAAGIEDVEFADRLETHGRELVLRGLGLLRYRVVFRAYVAALYLPEDVAPERALQDVPKRLEIEYFWAIDAADIARAGEEILARNVPPERMEALASRLEQLHALYEDVEPGDRYALGYVPGRGTELSRNGAVLGTIEGADFARAYFSIWLGEAPIDDSLREQLMTRRETAP